MKILIIDTNKDLEIIYKRKLKKVSKTLEFVYDIGDLHVRMKENSYDLILISHALKNCTGQEVYDIIRSCGYKGSIVIAATGRNIQKLRPQYNGIVGLVNKELNTKDFVSNILKLSMAA